jgi:hypothetical protein
MQLSIRYRHWQIYEALRTDILAMLLLGDAYVAFGPAGYRHVWRFDLVVVLRRH